MPDAVPILILWPFGPVRFLFEVGDTDGEPLPAEEHNPLFTTGKVTERLLERTKLVAENFAVETVETDQYGNFLAGTAAGLGVRPKRVTGSKEFSIRIKLNAKHDRPTKYGTLAHELGHIYCGHLGADAKGRWPDRRGPGLSPATKELEAEAVAWLVCHRNGLITRSEDYLKGLINETDLNKVSIYCIYEAANRVESRTVPKKI